MATLAQNIETLFAQIDGFETGARGFSTGTFISSFDGVLAAFEMLRSQPDQSAAVDELLYRKIREVEPTRSLMRFAVCNILGMFLFAWASGTSGYLRSYQELVRSRPENAPNDGDFIEHVLVPRLLQLRGLGGDAALGAHLLLKAADFLQTFHAPATFPPNATRTELERRGLPSLLLGFARHRIEFAGRLLREDPGAQEYGLKRERFFEWMCAQGRQKGLDVEPYLAQLELLTPVLWWQQLFRALARSFSGLGAALRSSFAWLPAGGVFWSGFWILVAAAIIVGVPIFWFLQYEHRLRDFRGEGLRLATKRVEVLSRSTEETP